MGRNSCQSFRHSAKSVRTSANSDCNVTIFLATAGSCTPLLAHPSYTPRHTIGYSSASLTNASNTRSWSGSFISTSYKDSGRHAHYYLDCHKAQIMHVRTYTILSLFTLFLHCEHHAQSFTCSNRKSLIVHNAIEACVNNGCSKDEWHSRTKMNRDSVLVSLHHVCSHAMLASECK